MGARAQRADAGPPSQEPFRHRPAPEVPGGRYKSHSVQNNILTIRATDGSTRQVQPWARGVVKISYFAPGRRPVADSSVSVVQPPVELSFSRFLKNSEVRFVYKSLPVAATATTLRLETGWDAGWSEKSEIVIDKASLRISVGRQNDTLFSEAAPA
ncbi:MAG: hypothetical protein EOO57_24370, partial [Hymenobacter sp.]